MGDLEHIREKFPIVNNAVFLNHAATSPLPKPVAESMTKHLRECSEFGFSDVNLKDLKWLFAKLINARPDEIAFVPNTSTGLNIIANMLECGESPNIVTTDLEFPSVVYPWLRRKLDVEVRYVRNVDGNILPEAFERAVDEKTVAIVVSHVEYANGFRNDLSSLSKIAHDHDALLVVDAIQSAGAIRVDVNRDDVDFLTTACYKWLLGPPGLGFLYLREELIEKFEPPLVGWASVEPEVFRTADLWDIWNLRLSKNARRFEVGSLSLVSCVGVAKALELITDYGIGNIEQRIIELTDYLIERVNDLCWKLQTPTEAEHRSGIVNFQVDNLETRIQKLAEKGIIVSQRAHGIRVSPHFYNRKEEIDFLVDELLKQGI